MKVKEIMYERKINVGKYENVTIGVSAQPEDNETSEEVVQEMSDLVSYLLKKEDKRARKERKKKV